MGAEGWLTDRLSRRPPPAGVAAAAPSRPRGSRTRRRQARAVGSGRRPTCRSREQRVELPFDRLDPRAQVAEPSVERRGRLVDPVRRALEVLQVRRERPELREIALDRCEPLLHRDGVGAQVLLRLVRARDVVADDPPLLGERRVHLLDDQLRLALLVRRQLPDQRPDVARGRLDRLEVVTLLIEHPLLLLRAHREVAELERAERPLARPLVDVEVDVRRPRDDDQGERSADDRPEAEGALPVARERFAQPGRERPLSCDMPRADEEK